MPPKFCTTAQISVTVWCGSRSARRRTSSSAKISIKSVNIYRITCQNQVLTFYYVILELFTQDLIIVIRHDDAETASHKNKAEDTTTSEHGVRGVVRSHGETRCNNSMVCVGKERSALKRDDNGNRRHVLCHMKICPRDQCIWTSIEKGLEKLRRSKAIASSWLPHVKFRPKAN